MRPSPPPPAAMSGAGPSVDDPNATLAKTPSNKSLVELDDAELHALEDDAGKDDDMDEGEDFVPQEEGDDDDDDEGMDPADAKVRRRPRGERQWARARRQPPRKAKIGLARWRAYSGGGRAACAGSWGRGAIHRWHAGARGHAAPPAACGQAPAQRTRLAHARSGGRGDPP